MEQRALSPGLRVIIGLIGVVILVIALFVAMAQVRAGWGSNPRAWLAAFGVLVVAIIAARLVQAAVRGKIAVRGSAGRRTR